MAVFADFPNTLKECMLATEQFSKLYYKTFDTQRHRLAALLYTDRSIIVWNGNPYRGLSQINSLLLNLPATKHELSSIDCQPINKEAIANKSMLVVCEGTVKYDQERQPRHFSQNVVLVSENNLWKIISDCFRFVDSD
jgi:NTF2-related export protein 1/2